MPIIPVDTNQIVITASRAPEEEAQTPASVTIVDKKRIERLGDPLVPALLRLSPSVAVATSGPAGSLTEVRFAAPKRTTHCCSSTESKSMIRLPATRRGSSSLTLTSRRASRWCAGRSRRCGAPKRSAA